MSGYGVFSVILKCGNNSHAVSSTALDLRALQKDLADGLREIASEELATSFASCTSHPKLRSLTSRVCTEMQKTLETTSTMDAPEQMQKVAASCSNILLDFLTGPAFANAATTGSMLVEIPVFRSRVASRAASLLDDLRKSYLSGARGAAPASRYLNKTRTVYEFVRLTLGVRMHGSENYNKFANGLGVEEVTVGENVSLIHEVKFPSYRFEFCNLQLL